MKTSETTKDKMLIRQTNNKGGAPKKRIKRERIVRIRMTATEHFLIDAKAKSAGMRFSSWVRAASKSGKVIPRLTAEERKILWMLTGLANNINQLTKLAHQLGLLSIVRQCREILDEIDMTLKNLNSNDRESDNG